MTFYFFAEPTARKTRKKKIFTQTIVAPTGVPETIETKIPIKAQTTEKTAEQIVTELKLLKILIAERDGKITRADIKSEPTRFIARTTTTAISTAIRRLYNEAFMPSAREKSSSKVTANILL